MGFGDPIIWAKDFPTFYNQVSGLDCFEGQCGHVMEAKEVFFSNGRFSYR